MIREQPDLRTIISNSQSDAYPEVAYRNRCPRSPMQPQHNHNITRVPAYVTYQTPSSPHDYRDIQQSAHTRTCTAQQTTQSTRPGTATISHRACPDIRKTAGCLSFWIIAAHPDLLCISRHTQHDRTITIHRHHHDIQHPTHAGAYMTQHIPPSATNNHSVNRPHACHGIHNTANAPHRLWRSQTTQDYTCHRTREAADAAVPSRSRRQGHLSMRTLAADMRSEA